MTAEAELAACAVRCGTPCLSTPTAFDDSCFPLSEIALLASAPVHFGPPRLVISPPPLYPYGREP
jgi:hypothetical protein